MLFRDGILMFNPKYRRGKRSATKNYPLMEVLHIWSRSHLKGGRPAAFRVRITRRTE